MIKKHLWLLAAVILTCSTAAAEPGGWGVSFGYGEADPSIDIYRLGLKKDFTAKWFENSTGYLSGYFELSYNRWEHDSGNIDAIAFSPVFAYYFGDADNLVVPYIEAGIGGAYLDEYHIADRNLSSSLQFEDRVGLGLRIDFLDLSFRYMHYSNASIKKPNHGIDILIFTTSIQF